MPTIITLEIILLLSIFTGRLIFFICPSVRALGERLLKKLRYSLHVDVQRNKYQAT